MRDTGSGNIGIFQTKIETKVADLAPLPTKITTKATIEEYYNAVEAAKLRFLVVVLLYGVHD